MSAEVWHDPETGEAFDPQSKCSWCRKTGQRATRLVWVPANAEHQWVCERCAANLEPGHTPEGTEG